jgi:hypothetical protein
MLMKFKNQKQLREFIRQTILEYTGTAKGMPARGKGQKVHNLKSQGYEIQVALSKAKQNQPKPQQIKQTSTKTDTTRWTHPYSSVTSKVTKLAPQPQYGWSYKTPKGFTYGQGTTLDYKSQKQKLDPKGKFTWNAPKATTNPTTKVTTKVENPDWTAWNARVQDYQAQYDQWEQDWEDFQGDTGGNPPENPGGTGTNGGESPAPMGGGGPGGGRGKGGGGGKGRGGKGKGKGRGKGKGKKREESLERIIGKKFINELIGDK